LKERTFRFQTTRLQKRLVLIYVATAGKSDGLPALAETIVSK
jgi:hypothetical protein